MKGDFHVRFRENLRVKLPWVTQLGAIWELRSFLKMCRWQPTARPTARPAGLAGKKTHQRSRLLASSVHPDEATV
jgi:hypothetical protein